MGRTRLQGTPLDTIWEINDELWQRTEFSGNSGLTQRPLPHDFGT
jgi:hypothetical protein